MLAAAEQIGRKWPHGHFPQCEARFEPRDPRQTRQLLLVNTLEVGEVPRQHGDEIVVLARHQVARYDVRRGHGRLLEGLQEILALTLERNLDEDRHLQPKSFSAEPGTIPLDETLLLQDFDASGNCRRRQRHDLGQLHLSSASVGDEGVQNGPIQRIKCHERSFQSKKRDIEQNIRVMIPYNNEIRSL